MLTRPSSHAPQKKPSATARTCEVKCVGPADPRPCSHSDVAAQLAQSRQALDVLVAQTREDAAAHLHTAQELSLLRHSLSDELAYLSEQLLSSLAVSDGKVTLLEDLEALHRNVKELESVKSYVQVIQHALKLR